MNIHLTAPFAFLFTLLLAVFPAIAQDDEKPAPEKPAVVAVGDVAPAFEGKLSTGETFSSADVLGKKNLVVYFYPAAMTGGCTKQACGYRDARAELEKHEALVLAVSGDEPEGLALFKQDSGLNFPLISDADGAIAKAFGVPTRKGGSLKRTVEGTEHTLTRGVSAARWTFVIGKDGKILHKDAKVRAAADSATVLKALAGESEDD